MRASDALHHRLDSLRRRRVIDQEFLIPGQRHPFLDLNFLHEIEQSARRNLCLFQEHHARLVGRCLLGSAECEIGPHAHVLAHAQRPDDRARITAAGGGGGTKHGRQQHGIGRIFGVFIAAGQMAAGNMAGFVGDDARDFQRVIRFFQHAGKDKDVLAAGDECVQLRAVHQHDVDIVGLQPRRCPDRCGVGPDRLFDLGVAEQGGDALRQRRSDEAGACQDSSDEGARFRIECQGSPQGVVTNSFSQIVGA